MDRDDVVECHFCDRTVGCVEDAMNDDWVPSFYSGDDEISEPVCPVCQHERLVLAADGELEVIDER